MQSNNLCTICACGKLFLYRHTSLSTTCVCFRRNDSDMGMLGISMRLGRRNVGTYDSIARGSRACREMTINKLIIANRAQERRLTNAVGPQSWRYAACVCFSNYDYHLVYEWMDFMILNLYRSSRNLIQGNVVKFIFIHLSRFLSYLWVWSYAFIWNEKSSKKKAWNSDAVAKTKIDYHHFAH